MYKQGRLGGSVALPTLMHSQPLSLHAIIPTTAANNNTGIGQQLTSIHISSRWTAQDYYTFFAIEGYQENGPDRNCKKNGNYTKFLALDYNSNHCAIFPSRCIIYKLLHLPRSFRWRNMRILMVNNIQKIKGVEKKNTRKNSKWQRSQKVYFWWQQQHLMIFGWRMKKKTLFL